jgi:hypothetical protein
MPSENAKDKAKRLRVEKAAAAVEKKAKKTEDDRKEALLRDYPDLNDRVKLALDPESPMAGKSMKTIMDFFVINNSAYYKIKNEAIAVMELKRARLLLLARLDKADRERNRRQAGELSAFDRGQSDELELRIAEETRSNIAVECQKAFNSAVFLWMAPEEGRPVMFEKATILAAVQEFHERVTSIKRGMCTDGLREMLQRLRMKMQGGLIGSEAHEKCLKMPSNSCFENAIKEMDIGPKVKGTTATVDRAAALENYRNAIGCAASWQAIYRAAINPALIFNVDEVGIWLCERGKVWKFMRFPKGMSEEAKARKLSAATQGKSKQPRMVYLECLSNAVGDLVATVVRIVDNTVDPGKLILKQADENVYVAFVNKAFSKEMYHKSMMKRIWLPRIRQRQVFVTTCLHKSDAAMEIDSFDSDASGGWAQGSAAPDIVLQQGEDLARVILSFDGAHEHIESVLKCKNLTDYCIRNNIALFKWAAGCSLVQQPNDVSKCHKLLHAFFKKNSYLFQAEPQRNELRPGYQNCMKVLDRSGVSADSKLTFMRFFKHLPVALHRSFSPDDLSNGYAVCGIHPFSLDNIMRGWNPGGRGAKSSWMRLDSESQAMVKVGIVKLSYVYAAIGAVTDEDVDSCVIADNGTTIEMLMDDADVPDYMKCQIGGTKINPGKGVNKRKCLDMTNPRWLAQERIDRARVRADPSLPKQIYGKDFDPNKCDCTCTSRQVDYHSKTRAHNSHVAAIVARLRADSGCVLDGADEGVKLARAWVVKHPSADPAENAPGVADLGVESEVLDQGPAVIVEISLAQASLEVDRALNDGFGYGLEEIDENVGDGDVDDESDGEEYDESATMDS